MADPVIIEAALNGSLSKDLNPNVPRTPDEIRDDALRAIDAGASIIHNHIDLVDVPGEQAAARYLEAWTGVVAARPDAILYPTGNWHAASSVTYDHIPALAASGVLRMSFLDAGSINVGPLVDGLPAGDGISIATFDELAERLRLCTELGLGVSIGCFEPGFLRTIRHWWRAGQLPRGAIVKLYFCSERAPDGRSWPGAGFGLSPTPTALAAYLELLEGCPVPWGVAVIGGDLVESGIAALALRHGGHLFTGVEKYAGPRTPTNRELVEEAVALCEQVGRPVASSAEAAAIIDLPR